MAAYRYWRTVFHRGSQYNPSGNTATVVQEIRLLDGLGANLVQTAGGRLNSSQGQSPSNAYDNSTSTAWVTFGGFLTAPGGDPYISWEEWDFGDGNEQDVTTLEVAIEASNPPQTVQQLASHDGVHWDIVSDMLFMVPPTTSSETHSTPIFSTPRAVAPQSPGSKAAVALFSTNASFTPAARGVLCPAEPPYLGHGVITGTVDIAGTPNTPVHRKVRLHVRGNGRLVAETWSDPLTGAYTFTGLNDKVAFYVVSFDYQLNYNAVVKDNVLPELAA